MSRKSSGQRPDDRGNQRVRPEYSGTRYRYRAVLHSCKTACQFCDLLTADGYVFCKRRLCLAFR